MNILVVGSSGSMGQRYVSIINYLGHRAYLRDEFSSEICDQEVKAKVDGIILATPTDCHFENFLHYSQYKRPILCEKPLSKNLLEVREMIYLADRNQIPFHMMFQYKNLVPGYALTSSSSSSYDYFRHGKDGLNWDCLQIIGLAKGSVSLEEKSPIWKCKINGFDLNSRYMDESYITSVIDWTLGKRQDLGEVLSIHEKVYFMEKADKERNEISLGN